MRLGRGEYIFERQEKRGGGDAAAGGAEAPWGERRAWHRETGILLPNNQRQHRNWHTPKDVLPLRICANYCAPGT